jgi:hypothetical protein
MELAYDNKWLPHERRHIRLHQSCVCVIQMGPDLLCMYSLWLSNPYLRVCYSRVGSY